MNSNKEQLIENKSFPDGDKIIEGDWSSLTLKNIEIDGDLTLNGKFKKVKIDNVKILSFYNSAEIEELMINELTCKGFYIYTKIDDLIINRTKSLFNLECNADIKNLSLNNFRCKNFIVNKPINKITIDETLVENNFECKALIQHLDATQFKILGNFIERNVGYNKSNFRNKNSNVLNYITEFPTILELTDEQKEKYLKEERNNT
jgi:hypothetical protein